MLSNLSLGLLVLHLLANLGGTTGIDTACQNSTTVSTSGELEEVLQKQPTQDCQNVTLTPGHYSLTRFFTLNSTSFVLQGTDDSSSGEEVSVTFQVPESSYDPTLPPYALYFRNVEFAVISGIQFAHSPGIIGFENVSKVVIRDSSFSWFRQGAVDIYQCYAIQVLRSHFMHNGPVFILRKAVYRGHAGGLSIGYSDYDQDGFNSSSLQLPEEVGAWIHGCTFLNNTSDPQKNPSTGQVLQGFFFPGRGGAVSVAVNSPFGFDMVITDCVVIDNVARSFGAGIYLVFSGFSPHLLTVNDTMFVNNTSAGVGSGGLSLGYVEGSQNGEMVRLDVHNCYFERNGGDFGGGLYLYADKITVEDDEYIALVSNCTFVRNTGGECGAAASLSSQLFFGTNRAIPAAIFQDCSFDGNDGGRGGVITTGYLPVTFRGFNHFSNNRGRVLVLIGMLAKVLGTLVFTGNDGSGRDGSGIDGGAIYTTSFSQVELHQGASISFIGNTGVFGAALIVDNMAATSLPLAYGHVQYNPLCVLRYENLTILPDDWEDVLVEFHNNSARYGSSVLTSKLEFCSFPDRDLDRVFRWDFTNFSNNTNTAHSPNSTSPVWYVETLAVEIDITAHDTSAYPGEKLIVEFIGHDELSRPTTSSIRLSNDKASLLFSPSVATSEVISTARINTSFVLFDRDTVSAYDSLPLQVEALFTEVPSQANFSISVLPCPPGYQLENTTVDDDGEPREFQCVCALQTNTDIRDCDGETLLLNEKVWAAVASKSDGLELFTHPCPVKYCQYTCSSIQNSFQLACVTKYNPASQNELCTSNREGVLCGDCTNRTGFTVLLNRCENCSYLNTIFVPTLIFLDIIVIGIFMMLKFGPPGWLYPTLFHVQLVPFLREGFRPFFAPFQPYAYYVSSALSFYFVYDFCLVPQLNALLNYSLRYIPFFITVAIAIVAVVFRYWNKMATRFPGLWWVILLQYSHLVDTSLTVLNCPLLPDLEDGTLSHRWYVNGNVQCFSGSHILLGALAILVLTLCVLLIPLVFIYAQGYVERPLLLSASVQSLSTCFKEEYPWWPAVELTRRLLFVVLTIPAIQADYPLAVYLSFTLLVTSFLKPYRQTLYNSVDLVLTSSTLVLIMLRGSRGVLSFDIIRAQNNSGFSGGTILLILGLSLTYYFPVIFFVGCCLTSLVIKAKKKYSSYKRKKALENVDSLGGSLGFSNISYQEADAPQSTNIMETLSLGSVPMSTLMRQLNINREDSNNSEEGEERRGRHSRGVTGPSMRRKWRKRWTRRQSSWTSQQFSWRTFKRRVTRVTRRASEPENEQTTCV